MLRKRLYPWATLLALCIHSPALPAADNWTRDWTSRDGQKLRSELIGVWGHEAFFNHGRSFGHIPVALFAEPDRKLIEEFRNRFQAEPRATWSEVNTGLWRELRKQTFVVVDGEQQDFEPPSSLEPEFYVLYFGAEWCAPCRDFIPKLNAWYRIWDERFDNFAMFFVSWDRSRREQIDYMAGEKLQFPGLTLGIDERVRVLRNIRPRGIPSLVVLDREGRPLFHTYQGEDYRGPSAVLDELQELLLWTNPDHPISIPLLFDATRKRYLENVGTGSAPPRLYRKVLPPDFFEICGCDEVQVTAQVQPTGRVARATFPEDFPAEARQRAEEILAEWLFMPAVENGGFVESTVRIALRADE